jgi:hypothetical protein
VITPAFYRKGTMDKSIWKENKISAKVSDYIILVALGKVVDSETCSVVL